MAGFTSRNFLYFSLPSVLGFSLFWLVKKKLNSYKTNNSIDFEGSYPDQYSALHTTKSLETDSIKESNCLDMQLKETESRLETEISTCNNVAQSSKVNGKRESMARLCGNGSSCSMGEPNVNGYGKDKDLPANNDSEVEVTNGMHDLQMNGSSSKGLCKNGICTNGDIKLKSNGVTDASINHHTDFDSKEQLSKSNTTKKKTSCLSQGTSHIDAKDQHHVDVHMQPPSASNTLSSKVNKNCLSSLTVIVSAENSTVLSEVSISSVCNGFSAQHSDTLTENLDTYHVDDRHSSEECSSTLSVNSDELSMAESSVESSSQCSTAPVSPASSVNGVSEDESSQLLVNDLNGDRKLTSADSTELLSLPIDEIRVETQGENIGSPADTYCDSLGSNDSGRGASEIRFTLSEDQVVYMVYEFEILPENCGRLIGKLGRHVKYINKQTNASILIKKHPCYADKRLCAITGTESEINAALKLIRKRFPIEDYPSVTLAQINSIPISTLLCPETLKLSLPEGGVFEALLCSTVNAGHFFLQQPTHPTFYQLPPLTNAMNALYGQSDTPVLENPVGGNVCAAEIGGGWYRAEINEVYEDSDNCRLKFLDYGGYADVAKTSIRKIKCDFMLIPFQATECYLAGVMPIDDSGWSAEAIALFEQEAQGQLIQGCIVAYAEDRVPFVNLYKVTGVESVFINQKLVDEGLAKGIPLTAVE